MAFGEADRGLMIDLETNNDEILLGLQPTIVYDMITILMERHDSDS